MVGEIYLKKPIKKKKTTGKEYMIAGLGREKLMTWQLKAIIPHVCKHLKLKEKAKKPTFVECLLCASHCVKTSIYSSSLNPHNHSIIPILQMGSLKLN